MDKYAPILSSLSLSVSENVSTCNIKLQSLVNPIKYFTLVNYDSRVVI